jgi:preprotein translocase subunit SecG
MIYGIVLGLHVLVCIILVLIVLLQSSKGTGLAGGAFGGGAESTVFGGRGAATVLSKATTIFGAAFMVTSLSLTLLGTTRGRVPHSVVAEQASQQAPLGVPATTAPPGEGAGSAAPGTMPSGLPGAGTSPGTVPIQAVPLPGGPSAAPAGPGQGAATPAAGTTAPQPPPASPGKTQGKTK